MVLRAETAQLHDRLKSRDYSEKKVQENLDAEIMEVVLSEARESYDEEIVVALESNEDGDVEGNVERIESWIANWRRDNNSGEGKGG